jgi:hypothetical protein
VDGLEDGAVLLERGARAGGDAARQVFVSRSSATSWEYEP